MMNLYGRTMSVTDPQKLARIAGVFFILTFVTAIAAVVLYDPVLNQTAYINGTGSGPETRVLFGGLLEVGLVIANIGTALVLFPILKRQNQPMALGYVASRIVESTIIAVGIVSLLSVVTLRQDISGGNTETLTWLGQSLVAVHDWTFLLGPGFCVGVGNGLLLGYLMYKSELVPRRMAMLGLIGGPLIFASSIAVLFGAYEQDGAHFFFSIPEILWEASLAIYLTFNGFRASAPILAATGAPGAHVG
jgi:Domain of unknown function (DUF4386)